MYVAPIIKVLYIAGWGRSGSTLLSSVLGSIPGVFAAGELAFLWQALMHPGWLCGCGTPLTECATWSRIFHHAFGGLALAPLTRMPVAMEHLLNKRRHGWRVLAPPLKAGPEEAFGLEQIGKLYRGIVEATGARVIVDSSKIPLYGTWLRQVPGLDVHFLHLIRDPRAVAFSWSREKANLSGSGDVHLHRHSTTQSAVRWIGVNQLFRLMRHTQRGRYFYLRYMDFLGNPHGYVDRILRWVGEPEAANPVTPDHRINLAVPHLAFGNPGRFRHGETTLSIRTEWRTEMPARDRRWITTLCAPWMLRYGYPLRTPRN